jgi:hypothetical protein
LDNAAKKYCQTAKRYYVEPNEEFSLDPNWRKQREVMDPEVSSFKLNLKN